MWPVQLLSPASCVKVTSHKKALLYIFENVERPLKSDRNKHFSDEKFRSPEKPSFFAKMKKKMISLQTHKTTNELARAVKTTEFTLCVTHDLTGLCCWGGVGWGTSAGLLEALAPYHKSPTWPGGPGFVCCISATHVSMWPLGFVHYLIQWNAVWTICCRSSLFCSWMRSFVLRQQN